MSEENISADTIVRYLALIRFFENGHGYGSYLITMHGKRPAKISKVDTPEVLKDR